MDSFIKLVGAVVVSLMLIIFIAFVIGFPVMWLWNWLMPAIFGLVKINIWKAIGLNVFCGLLFRSSINTKSND